MPFTIIPAVNRIDLVLVAAKDALAQEGVGESRVLIIGNGISDEDRRSVEQFCHDTTGAMAWFHDPPLPSLAATWNRALRFCWEMGEGDAFISNNDCRYSSDTISTLRKIMEKEKALLVTATGVEEEESLFAEACEIGQDQLAFNTDGTVSKGGPGFSAFLISRECHEKYQFDEGLTPAFCEDSDMHRQMMLRGDGDRIFGSNVRYLHLGGQTLKNMSPERRQVTEEAISRGSRTHYARKWGPGGVNQETFITPFNDGPRDPKQLEEIPGWILKRWEAGEPVDNISLFHEIRSKW